jgi:nucleotide-binding universal stress UspA family protein
MKRPVPKRILAAFDGSPASAAALRAAVELAKGLGASVEVLYAESPSAAVPFAYDGLDARAAQAIQAENNRFKAEWSSRAREITAGLPPGRVRLTWAKGWPKETILARSRAADLVAVGTHGREGARRLILGSVAEHVARHSRTPVLCLRENARLWG